MQVSHDLGSAALDKHVTEQGKRRRGGGQCLGGKLEVLRRVDIFHNNGRPIPPALCASAIHSRRTCVCSSMGRRLWMSYEG